MPMVLLVWSLMEIAAGEFASEATDVSNAGRCEFDHLPQAASPVWNLDNLEYPIDAITIEAIDGRNNGLRIGRADGTQSGRYTITLRASTHDWNPVQLGVSHSVAVRMAAKYSGAAFVAASVPGAGVMLDIGNGKCILSQRIGESDEQRDETAAVRRSCPTGEPTSCTPIGSSGPRPAGDTSVRVGC